MAGAKARSCSAVLALGIVLALLLSACGGGGGGTTAATTTTAAVSGKPMTKAAYVTKMRSIGRSLSNALDGLTTASTAAAASAAAAHTQEVLRTASDTMKAMSPPAAIRKLHVQLANAVRLFADSMTPLISSLKTADTSTLASIASSLQALKGFKGVATLSGEIVQRGYAIAG